MGTLTATTVVEDLSSSTGLTGDTFKSFSLYKLVVEGVTESTPSGQTVSNSGILSAGSSGWSATPLSPTTTQDVQISNSEYKQTNSAGAFVLVGTWTTPTVHIGRLATPGTPGDRGAGSYSIQKTIALASNVPAAVVEGAINTSEVLNDYGLEAICNRYGGNYFSSDNSCRTGTSITDGLLGNGAPEVGDAVDIIITATDTGTIVNRQLVHDGTGTATGDWEGFVQVFDGSVLVKGTVVADGLNVGNGSADTFNVNGPLRLSNGTDDMGNTIYGQLTAGLSDVSWDTGVGGSTVNVLSDNGTSTSSIGSGFFFGDTDDGTRVLIGSVNRYIKLDDDGLVLGGIVGSDVNAATVFRQDNPPTALMSGDVWYDTNDGNKTYVSSASGTGSWVSTQDGSIATAQSTATTAKSTADTANSTANTANSTATTANNNATAAASSWLSGRAYAKGAVVTYGTPSDAQVYFASNAVTSTTNPASDTTNWESANAVLETSNGEATTKSIRENSVTTTDLAEVGNFTSAFTQVGVNGDLDVLGPVFTSLLGDTSTLIVRVNGLFTITQGTTAVASDMDFDIVLYASTSGGVLGAELDRITLLNNREIQFSSSNPSGVAGHYVPYGSRSLSASIPSGSSVRMRLELDVRRRASAVNDYTTMDLVGQDVSIEYLGGAR